MLYQYLRTSFPAFLFFVFTACSSPHAHENIKHGEEKASVPHKNETPPNVSTLRAKKGEFHSELLSNGRLEVQNKAEVSFEIQEQIIEVKTKEGDVVKKGQVLGSLKSFSFQKALQKAKISYDQATIDLKDQLLGFGYDLKDSSQISSSVIKMARIRSNFNTATIAMDEARHNLQQTTIKAPISGMISNLQAEANNPSSAYEKFCDILDNSVMLISFHVLETELNFVKTQQPVEVMPIATSGRSFKGRILSINPSVSDDGMIRVTAKIPNPDRQLIHGMNAKVLVKNQVPDCLIVPREAVLYRQNRKVVFVYEDGKAMWHYVKTGYENSSEITITEGLKEGDEVIVRNNLNLAHESIVTRRDPEKSN